MAEQLQNTPSIGEIVLDPNEKFADLDGVDKFDLPLADGGIVDVISYPEYLASIKYINDASGTPAMSTALTSSLRGGVNWESFVHYDEAQPTWAVKYGVSWGRGVGQCPDALFNTDYGTPSSGTTGDGIFREVPLDFARSNFRVYSYSRNESVFSSEARLLMKSGGEDILLIETYTSFTTCYIRVTEGTDPPYEVDRSSEDSAVADFSVDYSTGVAQITGQMEQILSIEYKDVDQIFVSTKAVSPNITKIWQTSISFVSQNTAYFPNMTSPDLTCPYRVVADLTGE